jgi:tRNA dimethylallyltransferase
LASSSVDKVLCIVGPTASGKTDLALRLAARIDGELVSADMGQMYRGLDAGTAKPSGSWVGGVYVSAGVPCHLVDILDPSESTDAGLFASQAGKAVRSIRERGKRPILVGGAGLYLRALIEGLDPLPPRDPALRERLQTLAESRGRPWLHQELARRDPVAAARIPGNNLQRVIRALEICELTGKPASSQRTTSRREPLLAAAYIGLRMERSVLLDRIGRRAASMFPKMIAEARRLVPSQFTGAEPGFRCLGYPQALACARGGMDEEAGLSSMIRDTAAYAKRQATWFGRQTPAAWLEPENALEAALEMSARA